MDRSVFRALATALQTMELPPADAGLEDLLARFETAPSTRDAPSPGRPVIACAMLGRRNSDRAKPDAAALAA